MKTLRFILLLSFFFPAVYTRPAFAADGVVIALPTPKTDGKVSVEKALKKRRSQRVFSTVPLTLVEIGQLCWAAQGTTDSKGHRTASSAKAVYPLELYVISASVKGLPPGLYHYETATHSLTTVSTGDMRDEFVKKAVGQDWITHASAIFVISGKAGKMAAMKERAKQFMAIETGLAAQGLLLEVTALGLGGTFVGGFDPPKARAALGLSAEEEVLALIPVGKKP
jgi:SagB-type dehydrogenase family enzyme